MSIQQRLMASIQDKCGWMPFLLLPLSTWWTQADFNLALCYATGCAVLAVTSGSRQAPIYGIMAACSAASYFNPLLQTVNIFLASKLDTKWKTFAIVWITIFVGLSIFPLPFSIYFYGIPALILISWPLSIFFKKLPENATLSSAVIFITILLANTAITSRVNMPVHYGQITNLLSDNFIKNAISSGKFISGNSKGNMTTSFVFEKGSLSEESISEDGTYYFLGEHDNMNGFVKSNPDFNDASIRQNEPWAFNRPCMTAFLRLASMKDPFFCSNLGTTIKQSIFLLPLAWRYNEFGIPQVVIGKTQDGGKIFYLVGDSDIAVDFLAPYNANFLADLYGQNWMAPLPYIFIIILATILYLWGSSILWGVLCLIPIAGFVNLNTNTNKFDVIIAFEGITVKSPHIDNSPDKIINNLSRQKKTVRLGYGNAKNTVILVGSDYHLKIQANTEKPIVFLLPGARLFIDDAVYETVDIPLGNIFHDKVNIPDAREIKANGKSIGQCLIETPRFVIIGTASPQRMTDITKLLK